MRTYIKSLYHCLLLATLACSSAHAEDIDIFAGTETVDTTLPNIIFVLDNTANWSNVAQQWPDGDTQGQSEVRAIQTVLARQLGKLNVGLVEYVTGGSDADNDAGYVRHNLQPLTPDSFAVLNEKLDKIYADIETPEEKRSASNSYGDLSWDFYNYLNGALHSNGGVGTPDASALMADVNGYTTTWSQFKSPLGDPDACADTYVIYIGNNDGSNATLKPDRTANTTALKAAYAAAGETAPDALYGDNAGAPLGMPNFACETTTVITEPVVVPPEDVPEQIIPAYTIPGYTIPGEIVPEEIVDPRTFDSRECWKTTERSACTDDENLAGGGCDGETGCACTTATSNNCTTGKPADRTYRWNVVVPGYTIPEYTTEDVYVEPVDVPEEIIPAYTIPGYTIPGSEVEQVNCDVTEGSSDEGGPYNFDDWAKYLYEIGVPLTVVEGGVTYEQRVNVVTFVIDVFNRKQNGDQSSLFFSAAKAGGGRYFEARSEEQIIAAIESAVGDILAVSSSFAAVTLPLSSTNSSRQENQVYIGMFRPAPGKKPRWFGNLKRYRLASFNGATELADVRLRQATNILTGFAKDCAESFWTEDTDLYWKDLGIDPPPKSECPAAKTAGKEWSDLPDGPFVEKGGVAQMTRQGPAGTARKLYTSNSNVLSLIADTDAGDLGGMPVLDYLRGDAPGVGESMAKDDSDNDLGLRPSIHGDVVHSRPLSIRYDEDTTRIFYGANDGLFRAVDAANGLESWAFIHKEHFPRIQRLYDNAPLVKYEGAAPVPGATSKEYFFDGPTGQLVIYDAPANPASTALGDFVSGYIFPTMRRGGGMLYGFNVTNPDTPELMWRQGCTDLDDDTTCTTGFSDLGQTWSTPLAVYVAEYPGDDAEPEPLIVFGGGFDDCLNIDQAIYPTECDSAKGKGIYVLDALTGALVRYFPTDAPVITDVVPVDLDFDGLVDFIYAADVAGNLYRISKADLTTDLTNLTTVPVTAIVPRDEDDADGDGKAWKIEKIASIPGTQQRNYNTPAVLVVRGTIFVAWGTGDRERPLEANYPFATLPTGVQNRFYVLADKPFDDYVAEEEAIEANTTYTRRVVDLEGSTMYEVGTVLAEGVELFDLDGWYLELPDRGEQVANPAAILGGKVYFNTFQPGGISEGICTKPLGIGTAYAVSLFDPQLTEGLQLRAPGFPVAPIVANVLVPEGCTVEPCDVVPSEEECLPPAVCESENIILGGCSDLGVCTGEPSVPPLRGRTYYSDQDLERSID